MDSNEKEEEEQNFNEQKSPVNLPVASSMLDVLNINLEGEEVPRAFLAVISTL